VLAAQHCVGIDGIEIIDRKSKICRRTTSPLR
jgi:hypothetical protein